MLTGTQIAFVGGGNMANSLLAGLLRKGLSTPGQLIVSDPQSARRELLAERFGVMVTADNRTAVREADIIVLCVEPQVLDEVLSELVSALRSQPLMISVAAGYSLSRMRARLKPLTRLVRAMPNTPSTIGEGVTAVSLAWAYRLRMPTRPRGYSIPSVRWSWLKNG